MIGGAAADDAAADDDDSRLGGKCLDHGFSASDSFIASLSRSSRAWCIVTAASRGEKTGASMNAMKFCAIWYRLGQVIRSRIDACRL
jgi:hypothetical protein